MDPGRGESDRIVAANAGFDSLLDTSDLASRTIGAASAATPTPHTESRLPAELMARSSRRLGLVAILYAAGFVAGYLIRELSVHVIGGEPYLQHPHTPGQLMTALFALLALAVAAIARRRKLDDRRLLRVGLTFEVIASLGIALVSYAALWEQGAKPWGISWLCAWILVFPIIMPAPPRAATLASLTSAAMAPLAILIWAATRAFSFPSLSLMLATTIPNFVAAVLAILSANHLYRIGVELREAKRLGRYRLVAPLGRGGMGEVWIAEHDLLARPAALKLIRPELMSSRHGTAEAIARFDREAQSTASLTSPHTVRLYDFGVTDDGLFYSVMELLDGLDLHRLVREHGPMPPARAVHLLRQACASLAEAHAHGLVHRDIKPSNLFACRQGLETDFLKVLDFGLVRADQSDGTIAGTPAYMAPERWSGTAEPASDLFALGAVGWWLIGGEPPPGPPAGRPALEEVLLSCIDADPAKRPRDAAHLDALLAALPGPPWTQAEAQAWWRDRPVALRA